MDYIWDNFWLIALVLVLALFNSGIVGLGIKEYIDHRKDVRQQREAEKQRDRELWEQPGRLGAQLEAATTINEATSKVNEATLNMIQTISQNGRGAAPQGNPNPTMGFSSDTKSDD